MTSFNQGLDLHFHLYVQHVNIVLPEINRLLPGLTSSWLEPCADASQQEILLIQLMAGIRRCD